MTDVDVRVGQQMEIANGVARLIHNGEVSREFQIQELPQTFIQWQLDYKRRVYDAIEKDEYIAFNAGHLPVVATLNDEGIIPNLANKGVGFTPKDEHIEHYVKLVEDAVEQIIKLPPHAVGDTRALRIATAREFYKHPEHIDWRRLGLWNSSQARATADVWGRPGAKVGPARACSAREFYKHPEHIDWRRRGLWKSSKARPTADGWSRPGSKVCSARSCRACPIRRWRRIQPSSAASSRDCGSSTCEATPCTAPEAR